MIDDARPWVLALVVAFVGFMAHASSLDGQFLDWDDGLLVSDNAALREGGDLDRLLDPYTSREIDGKLRIDRSEYGYEYLPVRDLSYRLDYAIGGMNPRLFHWTNLLLHAVAAGLVFFLLREITGANAASFLGALIYATHPMASEVVDCIAHRKGLLMAVFFVGAWLAWLRDQKLLACLLYALAMLSKLPAIVLPAVLVLGDFVTHRKQEWRRWTAYGVLGALALADFTIASKVAAVGLKHSGYHGGTFFTNLLSSGAAFVEGFRMLFLPIGLEAGRVNESLTRTGVDLMSVGGVLLLMGIVAAGAYWFRERPLLAFTILLVPILQAPYLQIKPFWVLFAERYWLLALIPFGLWLGRLLAGTPRRRAIGFAIVALFFFGSYTRGRDWSNTETLFRDAIEKDDTNYIAHDKVGRVEGRRADALLRAGRVEEAEAAFERAIAAFERGLESLEFHRPRGQAHLQEVESNSLIGLCNSLIKAARYREIPPYVARLREGWPDDRRVQANVALLDGIAAQSDFQKYASATDRVQREDVVDLYSESERRYLQAALLGEPYPDIVLTVRRNLALLYHDFAMLHGKAGDLEAAKELLLRASDLDPSNQRIRQVIWERFGLKRGDE